jgi:fructokinase
MTTFNGNTATTFLVTGEALIDLIQQPDGLLDPKLGGSPWNLARALGRLGCRVQYRNPLSNDDYGQQLAAGLTESRVELTGGRSPCPTSLALVKVDRQGHPDYAFYREGVADRDLNPMDILQDKDLSARVFHVGSLSLLPPDGMAWRALLRALRARDMVTSVDINMRPMVAQDKQVYATLARSILAEGMVVKVSDEDLRAMNFLGDPLTEARRLLSATTQLVVLTLGAQGAWTVTEAGAWFQPPAQVPVVDAVGAGDCFYAGFLARLSEQDCFSDPGRPQLSSEAVKEAMAFGNLVTSINLQRTGCQPPWREEV